MGAVEISELLEAPDELATALDLKLMERRRLFKAVQDSESIV